MKDIELAIIKERVEAMNDEQFYALKLNYAKDSAQADRDGGDTNSIASDYMEDFEPMNREEFIGELNNGEWGEELDSLFDLSRHEI